MSLLKKETRAHVAEAIQVANKNPMVKAAYNSALKELKAFHKQVNAVQAHTRPAQDNLSGLEKFVENAEPSMQKFAKIIEKAPEQAKTAASANGSDLFRNEVDIGKAQQAVDPDAPISSANFNG